MKRIIITLVTAAVVSLSSCSVQPTTPEQPMQITPSPVVTATPAPPTPAPSEAPPLTYSLDDIPAYSGAAYITINGNEPYFSEAEMTTEAFERYSSLDSLGRCGIAYANIGQEIMPTEERGAIGQVKPAGWHTIRYDFIDGMYLYNRCHLIAYQLAGENANERNLITGTRYLNTEGMSPFENKVADYVEATGGHVLFRATPVYVGDNLIALGVQLEAKSVEDNGAGLSYNVFCYNVQPGVVIDYATGDSWADGTLGGQVSEVTEPPISTPTPEAQQSNEASESDEVTYILNTNTKKFHYPSCSSVSDMKEKNKREFTGSRDEAISQGYSPCGRCHP